MRHGVSGQGSLEVSVSGWDNDIYHVRIVEVETVVVLRKVRTSIPRTKNENFSHLISMGYQ